mgnify:CR=1 FL=1
MPEPVLTEIDHVAIAVRDLEGAVEYYRATYGVDPVHREVVENDGVEEVLLRVADSYIQLLTPVRDDSPVAKYLDKKGEGIHHVAYRVDDCAAALDRGLKVSMSTPLVRTAVRSAGTPSACAASTSARQTPKTRVACRSA